MDTETRYQAALDYLYSFVDYSLKHASELAKADFNLERMRALMAELGNPQEAYPTIHVAGTKGKGSTAALCASALRAGAFETGLYTSPHLLDFCERIQVDGQPIPREELAALVDEIKPAVARIPKLTTFELTTALGYLYFARQHVQAAVIEVGLGGRLDATNVITPRVAVITSLSYDHTAVLGETLTLIAGEKAGIIKPGVPVVSSPQREEALRVLERVAAERSAPLTIVGREVSYQMLAQSLDGQAFVLKDESGPPNGGKQMKDEENRHSVKLNIPLLGAHQVENAATAYAALKAAGLGVSEEAIASGFAAVRWPGRFEIARRENPTVIFDSAHNQDSFEKLAATLETYFPGRKVTLVFGVSEDKHLLAMLTAIRPLLARVIATRADHPRALEPEKIVEAARQLGVESDAAAPVETALKRALDLSQKDGSIVVSAGSLFVVADVKRTSGW
ncbi:MAG: folylpolyglutamate synthase/dihydrofolate synthase family protein [Anaerolineales bacterium]